MQSVSSRIWTRVAVSIFYDDNHYTMGTSLKAIIIPILISTLGTVTKGLVQGLEKLEIRGRVESVQTTALLRSSRILRRVLETWGGLLSLNISERPSINADVKSFQGVTITELKKQKNNKYLDLAKELEKKLWNMRM